MPKLIRSEKAKCSPLRKDILNFFAQNPEPTDQEVHSFAEQLGVDYEKLEEEIYSMTTQMLDYFNPSKLLHDNEDRYEEHSNADQEDAFIDSLFEHLRRYDRNISNFDVEHEGNKIIIVFDFSKEGVRKQLPSFIDDAVEHSGLKIKSSRLLRKGNSVGFTVIKG